MFCQNCDYEEIVSKKKTICPRCGGVILNYIPLQEIKVDTDFEKKEEI